MATPSVPASVPARNQTQDIALSPSVRETLASAIHASKAPNTRRAYRTAWGQFARWCNAQSIDPLAATTQTIAAYLANLAHTGKGLASIKMAASAINAGFAAANLNKPCNSEQVQTVIRGLARSTTVTPRQAAALDRDALAQIRGHLNGSIEKSAYAAKSMAICSFMSDCALRVSEASALVWGDIAQESDGSGRITIRKSKTDQEGEGSVVYASPQAMQDINRLRPAGDCAEHPVFNLSPSQLNRRIKAITKAAGLQGAFSGHSGRVGCAIRMTQAGAPSQTTMTQARWQTTRMLAKYTRNLTASEAGKYLG